MAAPRAATSDKSTNTLSIVAMVLSVIGCTFPIGLVLGYRARNQIRKTKQYGGYFATVAIVVGWAYLIAVAVALIAYVVLLVLK